MADAVKTQGTHVFLKDVSLSEPVIIKFTCPTGVTGLLSGSTDEIDTTCLDAQSRSFALGLSDQGELSIPFVFKPESPSHRTLFDLVAGKETTEICIALSDGDGVSEPTLDSENNIVPPVGRTSFTMNGLIKNPPIDIAGNEVVRGTMAVRVSGSVVVTFTDGETKVIG